MYSTENLKTKLLGIEYYLDENVSCDGKIITDKGLEYLTKVEGFVEFQVVEHDMVTTCEYIDTRVRIYLDKDNIITNIVRG